MSTPTTTTKQSGGLRALEIILGIIALIVGFGAIFFPGVFFVTLIVLFGIAMIAIGIIKLATALPKDAEPTSRKVNAGIGIAALIIGILVLVFPYVASVSLVVILSIGFMIWGVGLMVKGLVGTSGTGMKILEFLFGILVLSMAILMIFYPEVGIYTYTFFAAIAFMMIGIEALAVGIAGQYIS
jgi:uncharacterized membrane protein HdeD (DUF308 family)